MQPTDSTERPHDRVLLSNGQFRRPDPLAVLDIRGAGLLARRLSGSVIASIVLLPIWSFTFVRRYKPLPLLGGITFILISLIGLFTPAR